MAGLPGRLGATEQSAASSLVTDCASLVVTVTVGRPASSNMGNREGAATPSQSALASLTTTQSVETRHQPSTYFICYDEFL